MAIVESLIHQQENKKLHKEICKKLNQLMIEYNAGFIHSLPL